MSREGPETSSTPPATQTVDARGLRCPLPVIRLAQCAAGQPAGALLELWATDPAARADVPAWCRMRGHELVDVTESGAAQGGHTAYTVRLRGPAAP